MVHVVISHVDRTRFRILNGLSDFVFQDVLQCAVKVRIKAHTNLLFPGDKVEQVYLIESGWVKVYRLNEQGQESIVSVLGTGHSVLTTMIGALYPSPFGLKTETECEMIQIPIAHIRRMMREHYEFGARVLEEVSVICHNIMYHVEQLTVQPALQRVGSFLLTVMLNRCRKPDNQFDLPYGKSEIAHYLGLTPETFSRCLKLLSAKGVRVQGSRISLDDGKALCEFCDSHISRTCGRVGEKGYCRLATT